MNKESLQETETKKEKKSQIEQVHINGFKQVLDMLKIADPTFRESLLKRLAQRDLNLAKELRKDLEPSVKQ